MTGISEILVLVLLILCILILPRMIPGKPAAKRKKTGLSAGMFTMKIRAAIVLSVTIIIISALVTKPWLGGIPMFILSGILPVALGWALVWILSAQRKK